MKKLKRRDGGGSSGQTLCLHGHSVFFSGTAGLEQQQMKPLFWWKVYSRRNTDQCGLLRNNKITVTMKWSKFSVHPNSFMFVVQSDREA